MSGHALKLCFFDKHAEVIHSIILNSEDYDKIVNNKEITYEKLDLPTKWFRRPITHFILARFHISKFEDVMFQDLLEDVAKDLEYIRIEEI